MKNAGGHSRRRRGSYACEGGARRGPDCVGSHVRAHGSGLRACEAYGRPVVEEVRGAAKGEGIVRGLFPEEFEDVDRLSMGEDVK